jgi:2-C-methyl-D-erythritol 4-phosphate cytidylyltransferase
MNAAILLAAGQSTRMGGADKTLALLGGIPLIAHSLRAFAACDAIATIILVSGEHNAAQLADLAREFGAGRVGSIVPGGARRRDSVAAGLAALPEAGIVAVHDTARPLVTTQMIERGLQLAAQHGAAIVAEPVTDTIKQVALDEADATPNDVRAVLGTIDRSTLRAAQTPQTFRRDLLARAHASGNDDATDDAALVEALGAAVVAFHTRTPNPKVTRPQDLIVVEALLAAQAATQLGGTR